MFCILFLILILILTHTPIITEFILKLNTLINTLMIFCLRLLWRCPFYSWVFTTTKNCAFSCIILTLFGLFAICYCLDMFLHLFICLIWLIHYITFTRRRILTCNSWTRLCLLRYGVSVISSQEAILNIQRLLKLFCLRSAAHRSTFLQFLNVHCHVFVPLILLLLLFAWPTCACLYRCVSALPCVGRSLVRSSFLSVTHWRSVSL